MLPAIRVVHLLAVCVASIIAHAQVSVTPAAPRAQETVRVKVAPLPISADSFDPANRRITMMGNRITVELGPPGATFVVQPAPTQPLDIALGQFPAGSYDVEVRRGNGSFSELVGSAPFTVSAESGATRPLQQNTDLWWNPAESGWGLNVTQHGSGIIFGELFVYSSDGLPTWYVIPEGRWVRNTEYRGPIYRTTGPVVAQTFDPRSVTRTLVGQAVLEFFAADSTRMKATFTIDGTTVAKTLQRQTF